MRPRLCKTTPTLNKASASRGRSFRIASNDASASWWLTKPLENDGAGGERFRKRWLQSKRAIEPYEGMAQIAGIDLTARRASIGAWEAGQ